MRRADEVGSRPPVDPDRFGAEDYRALIDQMPIGIREEDWSGVRSAVDALRADGVRDFRSYFGDHRDLVRELAGLVRVWDSNAAMLRMFHAPTKEAFRDHVGQLLVHDGCRTFRETLGGFAQGEHRTVLREPAKTFDGGEIYVHDTVFIPDGHRDDWRRVVHTTQDFSEQHETELALRENEDRVRQLLETVKAIPWEVDATTWRHTYVGPQAVEILGYPQEAWYQESFWLDHVHPDDRMLASKFVRMHASEQRNYEFDYRMLDRQGNTKWLHDIVTVVSDKDGPKLLRGFMLDITARKTVEVELERQRSLFKAIFESAPDGLVVENVSREAVLCNPSFERIFGYSTEELVGKTPRMLYATEQEYRRQGRLRFNPGAEAHLAPYITQYRRKSGEIFPGEVVGAPIKDAQGTTLGFVGLIRDITESKRIEQQLRQAQKMEAVGQLTGGVAHDFNNLLTVLLGNLQMLQIGLERDGELRELTDTAVEAATRGAQLTRRLLAFSRLQLPKPQLVHVAKVIDGMDTLLGQTLGETIALELRASDGVWAAYTDSSELESALLNLAINGRDAMPDGGRLRIEAANVRARGPGDGNPRGILGEYVTITVTDTGKGIPSENLDRVLEPFYSTKEQGKGSGLGLSMVYGFVKRSNGHIDMQSHPDRGTSVTLYLPRAEEPDAAARADYRRLTPAPTGSETILVVEDQPLVRRTLSKMLQRLGYRVLDAEDAAAALEVLETCPDAHLLLTDVVMPGGMNGLELGREVKRHRPGIKILYTSGYASSLDLTADLLVKPYEYEELAAKIRAVLDR